VKRPPLIRQATGADVERVREIARSAYAKYVPRIGGEPAPMVADFGSSIAGDVAVVIESDGAVLVS
jgi:hypothetical protein